MARGILEHVAQRLLAGAPPDLQELCNALEGYRQVKDFRGLVQRYLPEEAEEVFAAGALGDQVSAFCEGFSRRYFPIHDLGDWFYEEDDGDILDTLLQAIPVEAHGLDDEDIHSMGDWGRGQQLLALLCQNPVDAPGTRFDSRLQQAVPVEPSTGVWLGLVDGLRDVVPPELIARIPLGGYSRAELHRLLDGTRFRALPLFADWLNWDTGNMLLNYSERDLQESYSYPDWSDAEVHAMTQEWRAARAHLEAMGELERWVQDDPALRLQEILDFIDVKELLPKEQLPPPLMDVFKPEGGADGEDGEDGESWQE